MPRFFPDRTGFGLLACVAGSALLPAAAAPPPAVPPAVPLQLHPERTSKNMLGAGTRGGQLVARQGPAGWRVLLGTRTVLDGARLGVVRMRLLTVAVARASDLVVVVLDTDTGCSVRFAVISVDRSGHAVASPPFGTCADLLALGVDGNALVFTMPGQPGADKAAAVSFRYLAGVVDGPLAPSD